MIRRKLNAWWLALTALALLASGLSAQVAVYRLDLDSEKLSLNFPFYEAGFLVLPANGGASAMILTLNEDGRRFFVQSRNIGESYQVLDADGREYQAFSVIDSGTSGSTNSWAARGRRDQFVEQQLGGVRTRVRTAKRLTGRAVVADSETDMAEPAEDGSRGVIGFVDFEGFLLQERTKRENESGSSVDDAADELVEFLERHGYVEDNADTALANGTGSDGRVFDVNGFDENGFDRNGFDRDGFDANGFNEAGFDEDGFDVNGLNAAGFDEDGFDANGFNSAGFNEDGFDRNGLDASGYNADGFDRNGFDRSGFNSAGFDRNGFDLGGFDINGLDRQGNPRNPETEEEDNDA